jgi:hypothetical protein
MQTPEPCTQIVDLPFLSLSLSGGRAKPTRSTEEVANVAVQTGHNRMRATVSTATLDIVD